MQRFYAPELIRALNNLTVSSLALTLIQNDQDHVTFQEDMKISVRELGKEIGKAPISWVLALQFNRLVDAVDAQEFNAEGVHIMAREFCVNYNNELASALFLMVPATHRKFYETPAPFGPEVRDRYPLAERDILSAGRCLALDEWTACIFHLMRVVEIGLRDMAVQLNIPMSASIDYLQWGELIDQINSTVNKMGQGKKSPQRTERQKFYAQAASNFDHFKNAWRIHVAHARDHYNERDAFTIWNHVLAFMRVLAAGAPP